MTTSVIAAVVHDGDDDFRFETVELDDLRSDEVLIRMEASGICYTDVEGKNMLSRPVVLGHEGTGIIEKTGSDTSRLKIGDRVVMAFGWCGDCPNCVSGKIYICDHNIAINFDGKRLDGSSTIKLNGQAISGAFFQQSSFASKSICLERDLVKVSKEHAPEMLAALPCGVMTGAGAILNSLKVQAGESLVIFGVGAVGQSAVMAGKLVGAYPIIAVDINDNRLEMAKTLGASHTINSTKEDMLRRIKEILPRGCHFSFDTTGNEKVLNTAIDCLAMGGHCGIVNAPDNEIPILATNRLFSRAAHLRSIYLGSSVPGRFIPKLIRLNQEGLFPYERLITTYKFKDINLAMSDLVSGKAIKPVLVMP